MQPPKSPLSGGLWKFREGWSIGKCLLISLIHHSFRFSPHLSRDLEIPPR